MRFLIILHIFFFFHHLIIRASVFLGPLESVLCQHANSLIVLDFSLKPQCSCLLHVRYSVILHINGYWRTEICFFYLKDLACPILIFALLCWIPMCQISVTLEELSFLPVLLIAIYSCYYFPVNFLSFLISWCTVIHHLEKQTLYHRNEVRRELTLALYIKFVYSYAFVCAPSKLYMILVPGALDNKLLCIYIDELYFSESDAKASSMLKN